MPFLLLAIFLKGPLWLRSLVLLSFGALFLFGCLYALPTFRNATQRTVPTHVTHPHRHPAHYVRS